MKAQAPPCPGLCGGAVGHELTRQRRGGLRQVVHRATVEQPAARHLVRHQGNLDARHIAEAQRRPAGLAAQHDATGLLVPGLDGERPASQQRRAGLDLGNLAGQDAGNRHGQQVRKVVVGLGQLEADRALVHDADAGNVQLVAAAGRSPARGQGTQADDRIEQQLARGRGAGGCGQASDRPRNIACRDRAAGRVGRAAARGGLEVHAFPQHELEATAAVARSGQGRGSHRHQLGPLRTGAVTEQPLVHHVLHLQRQRRHVPRGVNAVFARDECGSHRGGTGREGEQGERWQQARRHPPKAASPDHG